MGDASEGPHTAVPKLQPVPGLQLRQDHPSGHADPVKAAQDAAAKARYTLLSKNRRDVEKIVVAVLAAWTSHGECTVTYDHGLKHVTTPTQDDWARAYAALSAKLLQGGLGPVTAPHTEVWKHPQHGRTALRFVVRAVPLRPAETPQVTGVRDAASIPPAAVMS